MQERPTERADRFWSKKPPAAAAWDTIVIGSGIGGMTTAAMLAKLGKKVLVLEQHYVPGGYTHVFRRKGYSWDVGVHLVGEASHRALPGRILHALTDGRLRWAPVGEEYDRFYFPDGFEIGFGDNPEVFANTLKAAFPHEAAAIDAYLDHTRSTVRAMRGWFIGRALPGRLGRWLGGHLSRPAHDALTHTTAQVLARFFKDERLRALVAAQWGYHGAPPSQAAWAIQALVVRHFLWGANYPVGGAQNIAPALLQTVADAGGWTRICADVSEILVEGGKAVGVRLDDGEEIRAPRVVSAISAHTTVTKLLPEPVRQAHWSRSVAGHGSSPAHVCLYLGFKGDIAAAGATKASQWYYQTWSHEDATWDVHPDRAVPPPPILFVSYPSLKDPEHEPGPEQRHTGEIVTFVPWEVFQRWQGTSWRKRGPAYEGFKAAMTEAMLEVLFQHQPGLRDLLDHAELSTPLSTELFSRPHQGSIYGLMPTPERFLDPWLRPQSPVPGLYLSGSDASLCGVMGAMMSGVFCAAAMEPVGAVRFLARHAR